MHKTDDVLPLIDRTQHLFAERPAQGAGHFILSTALAIVYYIDEQDWFSYMSLKTTLRCQNIVGQNGFSWFRAEWIHTY